MLFLFGKSLADKDGAVERVGDFENLQAQVGIDILPGQPGAHGGLRLRAVLDRVLALDEGTEPSAEEEDFAVLLDVGQFVERLRQIRRGHCGLVPGVERTQALRDPILLDSWRVEVLVKVAGFDLS